MLSRTWQEKNLRVPSAVRRREAVSGGNSPFRAASPPPSDGLPAAHGAIHGLQNGAALRIRIRILLPVPAAAYQDFRVFNQLPEAVQGQ